MALTEAEEIKKRWLDYAEELYKEDFNDLDNHDVVITHLEPDILESEVKWTFSSTVATAEFSKSADILSEALSQHHLLGFETAPLEFQSLWRRI